jgi:hypothetical protein
MTRKDGTTPLYHCVRLRLLCRWNIADVCCVSYLLSPCVDIVCTLAVVYCCDIGETPLTCAAYCGHYDAVKALVEDGGADVNMTRQDGTTPLNLAAYADAKVGSRVRDHASAEASHFNFFVSLFCCHAGGLKVPIILSTL